MVVYKVSRAKIENVEGMGRENKNSQVPVLPRSREVQVCQGDFIWKKTLEFLGQGTISHLDSMLLMIKL